MSNRITAKRLQSLCDYLNEITGNPAKHWTHDNDTSVSNVGNYHISYAYGGAQLQQTSNEAGGVRDVFSGYRPKRELYDLMQAYISGMSAK